MPRLTPEVLRQCAAFAQYELLEPDLRRTVRSAADVVRSNQEHHIGETPTYDLLASEFFEATAREVNKVLVRALGSYARGEDASELGNSSSLPDGNDDA